MTFLDETLFRPSGIASVTIEDGSVTTTPSDEHLACWALVCVGALTADGIMRLPMRAGAQWVVSNQTTGSRALTITGGSGSTVTLVPGEWSAVLCTGKGYARIGDYPTEVRVDLSAVNDEYTISAAEARCHSIYYYGATMGDLSIYMDGQWVPPGHQWTVKNCTNNYITLYRGGSAVKLPAGAAITAVNIGDDQSICPTGMYYPAQIGALGLVSLPGEAYKSLRGDGSWGPQGLSTIAMADADQAPGSGVTDAYVLRLTGVLTANRNLTLPLTAGRSWYVINACTGAFGVVVKGATGTTSTVTNGGRAIVVTDGTNFYS
jgi:hypothetical protein